LHVARDGFMKRAQFVHTGHLYLLGNSISTGKRLSE
jgi:hypothetical protein